VGGKGVYIDLIGKWLRLLFQVPQKQLSRPHIQREKEDSSFYHQQPREAFTRLVNSSMRQGENEVMSLNTKVNNLYSVDSEASSLATSCLKLNRLKSETIKNSRTKSELDIIYLEDSVILQVQRKGRSPESYYGFEDLVVKRIKSAWEWSAEDELIAIASTSVNSLVVMGCDLITWDIPFESLPSLAKVSESEKANFEIDVDGSYLYWEAADLHVDLEDLKAAVDPEFKEQLLMEKLEYGKSFGRAISTVRKAHKLTQKEIEGLSDRHLRRIEKEGQQPTLDSLKKLSASHGLDFENYLAQVNKALE
jgi:hypothetical protein